MKLTLEGHQDLYAVEQLCITLFGVDADVEITSRLHSGKVFMTASTKITYGGKTNRASRRLKVTETSVQLRRRILQQSVFAAALPLLDTIPAWGALAGVRPTKLSTKHILAGGTEASARKLLQQVYYVTPERAKLAVECSASTVAACKKLDSKDISLYVGIPFCPTRCAYCSFVSRSIGKRTELMEPYLEAMYRELELTGELIKKTGARVRTVYIGGGTPTTLSAAQLDTLLTKMSETLDLSHCLEFTVECGRPDTITPEKLQVLQENGVDRISINPQSMVDKVLKASGRPHTAAMILESHRQAVAAGFMGINMDLIAGLPEDTLEGFRHSLDTIAALLPSNITVHTLALKKGADLFEKQQNLPDGQTVAAMVRYASNTLRKLGYKPYYLYRQKYMSGSFENIGWSREGADCLYNIYMMEEVHTIVSIGGGGMNKVNLPGGKVERFHNPKFPEEYIRQIESVLEQKQAMFALI